MPQRSTRRPVEQAVSAGGVVYRQADGRIEIVLCGRRDPPLWALPKGTPNPGESAEETATREVEEETGLTVAIEGKVADMEYWFTHDEVRIHKVVHHYLLVPTGGDLSFHDHEFDDVEWFAVNDALRHMTYRNEARIVEQAIAMIEANRGKT